MSQKIVLVCDSCGSEKECVSLYLYNGQYSSRSEKESAKVDLCPICRDVIFGEAYKKFEGASIIIPLELLLMGRYSLSSATKAMTDEYARRCVCILEKINAARRKRKEDPINFM